MQFPRAGAVGLILVTATCCIALAHVRAQTVTVQPFVGTQVDEMSPLKGHAPLPRTTVRAIAVRSDGSIARVSELEHSVGDALYIRNVTDGTAKTHTIVDTATESIVVEPYGDVQLIGRGSCKGTPAGQMQGFDVLYSESTHPDEGLSVTEKEWRAPKLGCYPLAQEWMGLRRNGELMWDTKRSLAHIKLGEPDPWYFAIPTNYTTRTGEEWQALIDKKLGSP